MVKHKKNNYINKPIDYVNKPINKADLKSGEYLMKNIEKGYLNMKNKIKGFSSNRKKGLAGLLAGVIGVTSLPAKAVSFENLINYDKNKKESSISLYLEMPFGGFSKKGGFFDKPSLGFVSKYNGLEQNINFKDLQNYFNNPHLTEKDKFILLGTAIGIGALATYAATRNDSPAPVAKVAETPAPTPETPLPAPTPETPAPTPEPEEDSESGVGEDD